MGCSSSKLPEQTLNARGPADVEAAKVAAGDVSKAAAATAGVANKDQAAAIADLKSAATTQSTPMASSALANTTAQKAGLTAASSISTAEPTNTAAAIQGKVATTASTAAPPQPNTSSPTVAGSPAAGPTAASPEHGKTSTDSSNQLTASKLINSAPESTQTAPLAIKPASPKAGKAEPASSAAVSTATASGSTAAEPATKPASPKAAAAPMPVEVVPVSKPASPKAAPFVKPSVDTGVAIAAPAPPSPKAKGLSGEFKAAAETKPTTPGGLAAPAIVKPAADAAAAKPATPVAMAAPVTVKPATETAAAKPASPKAAPQAIPTPLTVVTSAAAAVPTTALAEAPNQSKDMKAAAEPKPASPKNAGSPKSAMAGAADSAKLAPRNVSFQADIEPVKAVVVPNVAELAMPTPPVAVTQMPAVAVPAAPANVGQAAQETSLKAAPQAAGAALAAAAVGATAVATTMTAKQPVTEAATTATPVPPVVEVVNPVADESAATSTFKPAKPQPKGLDEKTTEAPAEATSAPAPLDVVEAEAAAAPKVLTPPPKRNKNKSMMGDVWSFLVYNDKGGLPELRDLMEELDAGETDKAMRARLQLNQMMVVSLEDLKALGRLPVRTTKETFGVSANTVGDDCEVFAVSFRWLSTGKPDDENNTMWAQVVQSLELACQSPALVEKGESLTDAKTFVWIDCCCVVQDDAAEKAKQMELLPAYMAACGHMLCFPAGAGYWKSVPKRLEQFSYVSARNRCWVTGKASGVRPNQLRVFAVPDAEEGSDLITQEPWFWASMNQEGEGLNPLAPDLDLEGCDLEKTKEIVMLLKNVVLKGQSVAEPIK